MRIDGAAADYWAASSVAGAGDFNGDGRGDVVVGAEYAQNRHDTDSGVAYVVYGSRSDDPADVDLAALGRRGMRIDGAQTMDGAGGSVAAAGDFNGDGRDDVIVGAKYAPGGREAGIAYVVYGRKAADPPDVELRKLGARGIRLDGSRVPDRKLTDAGTSVAGAGDVNGDGRDDVIVGAPLADHHHRFTGSAFIVYGTKRRDPADVDLAALGRRGMRIDGARSGDEVGSSVAAAGDVNDDGRDDVIIGVGMTDWYGARTSRNAYVVYGRPSADPANVDLADLGARGMRIRGANPKENAGQSVAAAGDLNGDGCDDVILGAPDATQNARTDSGSAYVVYGQRARDPVDVDLAAPGTRGLRIDGAVAGDDAGFSVAGGADVTGDGRDDIIIGAPAKGTTRSGAAYVVSGIAPTIARAWSPATNE
jgi:hypothetical protein